MEEIGDNIQITEITEEYVPEIPPPDYDDFQGTLPAFDHPDIDYARRSSAAQVAFGQLMLNDVKMPKIFNVADRMCEAKEETRRVSLLIHNWLCFFCELTNIHGMKWYVITPNVMTRILFVIYTLVFIITIPLYFFTSYIGIYNSLSASASVEWKREVAMPYPNLTVCFPKYFDTRLMRVENISEDLANFITMTLDPNVGNLVSFMKDDIPSYEDTLERLQIELDHKLMHSEVSLIEVFHKIAMKCENFIVLCEVHRQFLTSEANQTLEQKCCGGLFNPEPFFTKTGTCFTTYKEVTEILPFTFSSIKIWLNTQSKNSPEYSMIFKGPDAIEMKGAFYAISENDHPVTKLFQSPFKAQRGTNVLVSLNIQQIDRSSLRSDIFCRNEVPGFESEFRVPYTKLNCDFFVGTGGIFNCTHAPYYGIDGEWNETLCEPKDFLNVELGQDEFLLAQHTNYTPCLPNCIYTEYITEVTEALIDTGSIKLYSEAVGINQLEDPEDLIVLQLYFNSFDFALISMSQTDFVTYLGTIGGWLSLLDGFSLVSLAELIFFLGWLTLKIMFKRSMEKKKTPSYLLQGGKIPII